jgi:hypothetical protein
MSTKSLLFLGVLAFSTLSIANTKSYHVTLHEAAMVGSVALSSGDYRVKVEGSNAIFTGAEAGQSFTVPVKVENAPKKYENTAVESTKQGDSVQIKSIEFGGSDVKLDFGD